MKFLLFLLIGQGDSKMNFSVVPEAIFGLLKMRFKFYFQNYK